jgi:acetyl esterase
MAVDPQIQALLGTINAQPHPDFAVLTADQARAGVTHMLSTLNGNRSFADVTSEDITLAGTGLRARLYRPVEHPGTLPCLVFFHGGGWVVGDLDTHDTFCRRLTSLVGCTIIAVDYRLAPEHPFPAAVDDALAAVAAIRDTAEQLGVDPRTIVVGGDSAGGNLAAIVAQTVPQSLAGQFLICASTDLAGAVEPGTSRALFASGYIVSEEEISWYADQYVPQGIDRTDWRVSPLRGTFIGLVPAIVATAGYDPLRDEGLAYTAALAKAGTDVTHHNFSALVHGFNLLDAVSPEADRAVKLLAASLRSLMAKGATAA